MLDEKREARAHEALARVQPLKTQGPMGTGLARRIWWFTGGRRTRGLCDNPNGRMQGNFGQVGAPRLLRMVVGDGDQNSGGQALGWILALVGRRGVVMIMRTDGRLLAVRPRMERRRMVVPHRHRGHECKTLTIRRVNMQSVLVMPVHQQP